MVPPSARSCCAGFGPDRLRCNQAMKTAQREPPNRWAKVPSNRAPGAVGLNRSCSIYRAAKQEKLQLLERCFFLTSTFIELLDTPSPRLFWICSFQRV